MKNLLSKEIRLAASPLSWFFIAFAVMTMIPGYPILVGAFFACFGIFHSFQSCRENNDILYTALLPVRKADTVKAKFAFCCMIQMITFVLMLIMTIVRMRVLPGLAPYVNNAMMNANPVYLAFVLIVFLMFNVLFVRGFFKTAWKYGKLFILFAAAAFAVITVAEVLHHLPGLAWLNSTAGSGQWPFAAAAFAVYAVGTFAAYKRAVTLFERVDL